MCGIIITYADYLELKGLWCGSSIGGKMLEWGGGEGDTVYLTFVGCGTGGNWIDGDESGGLIR